MTTYRLDDGVAHVQALDRVTLLLLREPSSLPVALTGPGVSVWQELCSGPRDLGQIVSAVAKRFQVDDSLVESDVGTLCRQLVQAGFLVPADDDEGSADR